ncbi:hypothetical protein KPH14_012271 [Odynerus spinipes]|uniref:DUF7041 domain-containing protein n=1 Tax=Odynerus spinipes TaxID=1348599 RepID=A0AAD9RFD6_9HYME|nr:hypothetical protein KPH14_012271 [Odynerus spinipes]
MATCHTPIASASRSQVNNTPLIDITKITSDETKTDTRQQAENNVHEQNPPPALATLLNEDFISAIRKVQLPSFMQDRTDIWFFVIESEFQSSRIVNDLTKYNALVEEVKELRHMFTEFLKSSWTKDSNNNGHYQNQTRRLRSRSTTPNQSGSAVSVLSKKYIQNKTQATEYKLYAANNTVINTYGKKYMEMDFGLRRAFKWNFLVADVTHPIIGQSATCKHPWNFHHQCKP